MPKQRFALFTHDAYGLGHIRRSSRILTALAERRPDASLLLITGSPFNDLMRSLPRNADIVKIPTIVTSGDPEKRPSMLTLGVAELAALRAEITQRTLAAFEPDVLLVDNFPLGVRLELLPALRALRNSPTRTALGLRDIVDPPEKVRRDWGRDGLYDIVGRYYDRVFVYGMREALDAAEAYALPDDIANKLTYCGYVSGADAEIKNASEVRRDLGVHGDFFLVTVGGGGDGRPLIETFMHAMQRFPSRTAVIASGEFMAESDLAAISKATADNQRIVVRKHIADLPSAMAAAGLVVAMGGYNTCAEVLAVGARAVIVPRNWRSGEHDNRGTTGFDAEQLVRAEGLAKIGAVQMADPKRFSADALADAMQRALDAPRFDASRLRLDGAGVVAEELIALAESRDGAR
jgi:predicted glycosyltransferase